MSYLKDFQEQVQQRNFHKFFQLWEEYCTSEEVDAGELIALLDLILDSDFKSLFGRFVETAIPLWETIENEEESYQVLRRLIDLQTTNSSILAQLAIDALKRKHGKDPHFKDRMRQVGLRTKEEFQGAITNYDLIDHLEKGNFVFHAGGWGTGEIMDVSPIREQTAIEFENVLGIKHFSFDNACKALVPLDREHFLARRFTDPDLFEAEAKKDPLGVIKLLLQDLGPKSAAEIKDEMCGVVIPESEWSKWWQSVRAKLKKDTMIESPSTVKKPFALRKSELSHVDRLYHAMEEETAAEMLIHQIYAFARDFPQEFKEESVREELKEKLIALVRREELTPAERLQLHIFLATTFDYEMEEKGLQEIVQSIDKIDDVILDIDVVALKKRALQKVRKYRDDWQEVFSRLFFTIQQNALRDYILSELNEEGTSEILMNNLEEIIHFPQKHPEVFVWYFQKVVKKGEGEVPYHDREGKNLFLEMFLILLHKIENGAEHRETVKKMYQLFTAKRFELIRALIEETSVEFIQEFLLLVSKCHTFSNHEKKMVRSLAYVVHPSLAPKKKKKGNFSDPSILWTTEEGYIKTQERIKHIATVEMIENAKEVEEARALGDLRENAEYKFACERRSRLQNEMKVLSKDLNKARVLTEEDVDADHVGVGAIVEVKDPRGGHSNYTILGPWEANPEKNIVSYKSQLAQSMLGKKVADTFSFKEEEYTIVDIGTVFEN